MDPRSAATQNVDKRDPLRYKGKNGIVMTLAINSQSSESLEESLLDDSKDLFNESTLSQTSGNLNSADSSSELFG